MKKNFLLLLSFLCVTLCASAKEYPDSEFTTLFNGKNFDGWNVKLRVNDPELAKKVFAIEDGMVRIYGEGFPAEYELDKTDTHGMMYSVKKYNKYIFRFKYKWGKNIANNFSKFQYDAGFYYHVVKDDIWPEGVEYQIRYNHTNNTNHTGDFYAGKQGKFNWYSDGKNRFLAEKDGGVPNEKRKSLFLSKRGAQANALNGEWNDCEIIVMEDQYAIHKLNGVIVNMATDIGYKDGGVIGLQAETAEIYYKDIMILEFDEVLPIENFIN